MAPIAVGDKIPDGTMFYLNSDEKLMSFPVYNSLKGKVVLAAVPGAFTPTCSSQHVPSFLNNAEAIKAKGVDEIIIIAANDPFVLKKWEETYDYNKRQHIKFLADGSGEFSKALGLEIDMSSKGMGTRAKRYALLIDDLVVKVANVEQDEEFVLSGGEDILKSL